MMKVRYKQEHGLNAIRYDGANRIEVLAFMGVNASDPEGLVGRPISLKTPLGIELCQPGDYMVHVAPQEFRLCKAENFDSLYEEQAS